MEGCSQVMEALQWDCNDRNNKKKNTNRRWKKRKDNKRKNTDKKQKKQKHQDEKHKQEAEERMHETEDIRGLIQERKQLRKHITAELYLTCGDIDGQGVRLSVVEESAANIKEQIKAEVKQFVKTQPRISKQMAEQTIPCLLYTSRCV